MFSGFSLRIRYFKRKSSIWAWKRIPFPKAIFPRRERWCPRPVRRQRRSVVVARAAAVLVPRQCEVRSRFVVERLQVELALQNRLHALVADGAAVQGSRTGTLHALQWIALRMTRERATHAIPPESGVVVLLPRPIVFWGTLLKNIKVVSFAPSFRIAIGSETLLTGLNCSFTRTVSCPGR